MYITNLHPPLRNPTAALEGYKLLPGCKPSLDVRTLATVLDLATCLVGGWKRGSRDAEVTARAYLVEDKNQGFRLEMAFWRHWRVSRARPCFIVCLLIMSTTFIVHPLTSHQIVIEGFA